MKNKGKKLYSLKFLKKTLLCYLQAIHIFYRWHYTKALVDMYKMDLMLINGLFTVVYRTYSTLYCPIHIFEDSQQATPFSHIFYCWNVRKIFCLGPVLRAAKEQQHIRWHFLFPAM